MPLTWTDNPDTIDWDALESLYRPAQLGPKSAAHLRTVFSNGRFTCIAREQGVLVTAVRWPCACWCVHWSRAAW